MGTAAAAVCRHTPLFVEWVAPLLLVCPWHTGAAVASPSPCLCRCTPARLCLRLRLFPLVSVVRCCPCAWRCVDPRTCRACAAARRTLATWLRPRPLPSLLARRRCCCCRWWQRRRRTCSPRRRARLWPRRPGAWRGLRSSSLRAAAFLDRVWDMFAPQPVREDVWLIAAAERADGSVVDALTRTARVAKPARLSERFRLRRGCSTR